MKKINKDEILASYSEDNYETDEAYEYFSSEDRDYTIEEANKLLDSNTNLLVRVEGMNQGWQGSREVDTIINETKLEDIMSEYMNIDNLSIEVYTNRVEVTNCHHDGTNRYTLYPFNLSELTIKELKEYFSKDGIEDFNWEMDGTSFSRASKSDLIDYVSNNELHLDN